MAVDSLLIMYEQAVTLQGSQTAWQLPDQLARPGHVPGCAGCLA